MKILKGRLEQSIEQLKEGKVVFYVPDDGPLTEERLKKIREQSPATATPTEKFTERLF